MRPVWRCIGVVVVESGERLLSRGEHGLVVGDEVVEIVEPSGGCHPLTYN
jgi:hypothetical protein